MENLWDFMDEISATIVTNKNKGGGTNYEVVGQVKEGNVFLRAWKVSFVVSIVRETNTDLVLRGDGSVEEGIVLFEGVRKACPTVVLRNGTRKGVFVVGVKILGARIKGIRVI